MTGHYDALNFPWKNIGRDIGKKLRDVINPPTDSGPTKAERRSQRLADTFKGFTYLDDFDELAAWTVNETFESQPANTPIFERAGTVPSSDGQPQSRLLLCHDYQGGYHDYESNRPLLMSGPMYFCNYLQHVDTFVYFSHKLVSCPPPTWINLLHRNGVKALGTFIIEPGIDQIERMFDQKNGEYVMARQLASIADHLGFDGWLLNIEEHFSLFMRDPKGKLLTFIESLRSLLGPQKSVLWYDALTHNNEVDYQNSLTSQNWEFAKAAGALFTNYAWKESHMIQAAASAKRYGLDQCDVFFGIDMWAQNTNKPGRKRVTYPEKGGGGTMTGFAVSALSESGFSAAILAPAWSFEHFRGSAPDDVDLAVWQGSKLPTRLDCDCQTDMPHHIEGYQDHPVVASALESFAGITDFFETDFRTPFERAMSENDTHKLRSRLGLMQTQICVPNTSSWIDSATELCHTSLTAASVSGKYGASGRTSSHLEISLRRTCSHIENLQDSIFGSNTKIQRLPLFKLKMGLDKPLKATVLCNKSTDTTTEAGIYLKNESVEGSITYTDLDVKVRDDLEYTQIRCQIPKCNAPTSQDSMLVELGVWSKYNEDDDDDDHNDKSQLPSSQVLLELRHITITRVFEPIQQGRLTEIRAEKRKRGSHTATFLIWRLSFPPNQWRAGRPWSHLTGPYEYFEIEVDDIFLGESLSCEILLKTEINGKNEIGVAIRGKIFGEVCLELLWEGKVCLLEDD